MTSAETKAGASAPQPGKPEPKFKSVKNLTVPMRTIRTSLIRKEELFMTLALAEVTGLPVLFVGAPGVAKTAALVDYMAAMVADPDKEVARQKAKDKLFIIELDESTRSGEIKGRVDMKKYAEDHEYFIEAPIVDAEAILINEVDKGSSAIRNAMLSIMREKRLFLGKDIRKCHWKIFAASCNIIPSDELENPFWDRFIIKHNVSRVTSNDIMEVWEGKKKDYPVAIPTQDILDSIQVNMARLKMFCEHIHKYVSDRTLTFVPQLVKAVKVIWKLSDVEAIVKVCSYIAPKQAANVAAVVEDQKISMAKNELQNIRKLKDPLEVKKRLEKIIFQVAGYSQNLSGEDMEAIVEQIRYVSYAKPMTSIRGPIDKQIAAMMMGEDPSDVSGIGEQADAFGKPQIVNEETHPVGNGPGTNRVKVDIVGGTAGAVIMNTPEEEPQF